MNDHPLVGDLTQLSHDELDKKYNELSRRWQLARRINMDQYVMHQLDLILESMEAEKYRRMELPEDEKTVILDTDPIPEKNQATKPGKK